MKNCCFNCSKRHLGCHTDCPDYKQFREELAERTKVEREEREIKGYLTEVHLRIKKCERKHKRG